jgi:hypothetical protein
MAFGHALAMSHRAQSGGLLSAELLTNGSFATDTVWVKGLNWTIAAGVASVSAPAAASRLYQTLTLVVGALYRVEFTISGYVGGAAQVRLTNGGTTGTTFMSAVANGTYVAYAVLAATATELSFVAPNSAAVYSIDNVSLKRVL